MRAAQKLYEAGHITYMRTDSVTLSKDAVSKMLVAIEKEFGKDYVEARTYTTKSTHTAFARHRLTQHALYRAL